MTTLYKRCKTGTELIAPLTVCMALMGTGSALAASDSGPTIITIDVPGAGTGANQGTIAVGNNNKGWITGNWVDSNKVDHGFVRSPDGTITTFDYPGATTTAGTSINEEGAIAGIYLDANGAHGLLRDADGTMTGFDVPGSTGTVALSINRKGEISGSYTDANFANHGFVRDPSGVITTYDAPHAGKQNGEGTEPAYPAGLNGAGFAVGLCVDGQLSSHGYVRGPGGKIVLIDIPGSVGGYYLGTFFASINGTGAIAGNYNDSNTVSHGFVLASGAVTRFDVPGEGTCCGEGTFVNAMNEGGGVTGFYLDTNFVFHGFLRTSGGLIKSFDPLGSIFTFPWSINASGAVSGYYNDANSVHHGFLLTP